MAKAPTPTVCPTIPSGTSSLLVNPNTVTIGVGSTGDLQVTNQSGVIVADCNVKWTSTDTRLATINATGLVTALKAGGPIAVRVTSSTKPAMVGSAAVTLSTAKVGAVSVPSASIIIGTSVTMGATVKGTDGSTLANRIVRWSTSSPAVATVDSVTGKVMGVGTGSATISATSEGVRGTATVTVVQVPVQSVSVTPGIAALHVGQTVQLSASAKDSAGGTITGRPVTWSSSSPSVATVSAQGLVTAVAAGSATLSATVEGKTGTATVTVALVPVQTVTVTPASGSLYVGQTLQLSASAKDSAGNALTGRSVTWSSGSPGVATISAQGLVTAVAQGNATLTATVEGKTSTATVTVPEERIYFHSSLDGTAAGEEIYSIRPDGTGLTQVTTRIGADIAPVLSPDRQRMALASEAWCAPGCVIEPELYVTYLNGTGFTRLTTGMHPIYGISWSPDATKLVVESQGGTRSGTDRRLYVIPVVGGSPVQLTNEESQAPEWSPDGRHILYCSPAGVIRINSDGSNRQVLRALSNIYTSNPSCTRADWSPDGAKIVFSLNNEQSGTPSGLWIMDADGSNAHAITSTMDYSPRWSPDGRSLTFFSREGTNGYYQIFTIDSTGANRRQLTSMTGHTYSPSWH